MLLYKMVFKFNEFYSNSLSLLENINQAKKLVEVSKSKMTNVEAKFSELLKLLLSPDSKYTDHSTDQKLKDTYGDIEISANKERANRILIGMFTKFMIEENVSIERLTELLNQIDEQRINLKNLIVTSNTSGEETKLSNLLDIFTVHKKVNDGRSAFEMLQDSIISLTRNKEISKWIVAMPSHLRVEYKQNINSEEVKDIINMLNSDEYKKLKPDFKKSIWNVYFKSEDGKSGKIARFKTLREFRESLELEISKYAGEFNFGTVIKQIEKAVEETHGCKLTYSDLEKGVIIAEIFSYKASRALGEKSSWCISYDEGHFNHYMGLDRSLYFLWNFNYSPSSNLSKLGINVNADGTFNAVHIKNDEAFKNRLPQYCEEWNIDIKLFAPISEEEKKIRTEIKKTNEQLRKATDYIKFDLEEAKLQEQVAYYQEKIKPYIFNVKLSEENTKNVFEILITLKLTEDFYQFEKASGYIYNSNKINITLLKTAISENNRELFDYILSKVSYIEYENDDREVQYIENEKMKFVDSILERCKDSYFFIKVYNHFESKLTNILEIITKKTYATDIYYVITNDIETLKFLRDKGLDLALTIDDRRSANHTTKYLTNYTRNDDVAIWLLQNGCPFNFMFVIDKAGNERIMSLIDQTEIFKDIITDDKDDILGNYFVNQLLRSKDNSSSLKPEDMAGKIKFIDKYGISVRNLDNPIIRKNLVNSEFEEWILTKQFRINSTILFDKIKELSYSKIIELYKNNLISSELEEEYDNRTFLRLNKLTDIIIENNKFEDYVYLFNKEKQFKKGTVNLFIKKEDLDIRFPQFYIKNVDKLEKEGHMQEGVELYNKYQTLRNIILPKIDWNSTEYKDFLKDSNDPEFIKEALERMDFSKMKISGDYLHIYIQNIDTYNALFDKGVKTYNGFLESLSKYFMEMVEKFGFDKFKKFVYRSKSLGDDFIPKYSFKENELIKNVIERGNLELIKFFVEELKIDIKVKADLMESALTYHPSKEKIEYVEQLGFPITKNNYFKVGKERGSNYVSTVGFLDYYIDKCIASGIDKLDQLLYTIIDLETVKKIWNKIEDHISWYEYLSFVARDENRISSDDNKFNTKQVLTWLMEQDPEVEYLLTEIYDEFKRQKYFKEETREFLKSVVKNYNKKQKAANKIKESYIVKFDDFDY